MFEYSRVAVSQVSAYAIDMANGLMPLAGLCALYLVCAGCSSNDAPESSSAGGREGGAGQSGGERAGSSAAGLSSRGGEAAAGTAPSGGSPSGGSGGEPGGGASGGPPPAVDGQSIYALECRGESKDCHEATVPCFGVGSPTPNVAAGWACANRCNSPADCSDAPSGAEAQASCVSFTSSGHCVLVCQNQSQSFSCPAGMTCYTPPKSPIGYCLWQ